MAFPKTWQKCHQWNWEENISDRLFFFGFPDIPFARSIKKKKSCSPVLSTYLLCLKKWRNLGSVAEDGIAKWAAVIIKTKE